MTVTSPTESLATPASLAHGFAARSRHPETSFTGIGGNAKKLLEQHDLQAPGCKRIVPMNHPNLTANESGDAWWLPDVAMRTHIRPAKARKDPRQGY